MINDGIILICGYRDLYGKRSDSFTRILKYPLKYTVAEVIRILHLLRSNLSLEVDFSLQKQIEILDYLVAQRIGPDRYNDISYRTTVFVRNHNKSLGILFNRPSLLFSVDYLIRNSSQTNEKIEYTVEFWNDLVDFILECNDVVVEFSKEGEDDLTDFEKLNARSALLNELLIVDDPFRTFERFITVFRQVKSDSFFGPHLDEYFNSIGLSIDNFLKSLITIYIQKGVSDELKFLVRKNPNDPSTSQLIDWLSANRQLPKKGHQLDLMTLYKWPILQIGEGEYLIIDLELIIGKAYYQLVNDFYFDWLRIKGITYQKYKAFFGQLFEEVIFSELNKLHKGDNLVLTGDLLKRNLQNGEIELADFLINYKKNTVIGEIKSSNFTLEQKFEGPSKFYKNDRAKFFKDFGLDQLIKSLEYLNNQRSLFSTDLSNGRLIVYPVIVLNDKFFQTPIMNQIFDLEFKDRTKDKFDKLDIRDLILMSIADIERLQSKRFTYPLFWKMLNGINRGAIFKKHFSLALNKYNIKHYNTMKFYEFLELD